MSRIRRLKPFGALPGKGCQNGSIQPSSRHDVSFAAYIQISRADILFAWIDDLTCYGSLVEIGIAHALGKTFWIAFPQELNRRNLWFAESLADRSVVAEEAETAFKSLLHSELAPQHVAKL
jgi:hypothetical protein